MVGVYNEKIYYGDLGFHEQQIIEKIVDAIQIMSWDAKGCSGGGTSIKYYSDKTEWLHNCKISKENKSIVLDSEYFTTESVATLLYIISPYLLKDKKYKIDVYTDEDYMFEITVVDRCVYIEKQLFSTNNELAFPFPSFSNY